MLSRSAATCSGMQQLHNHKSTWFATFHPGKRALAAATSSVTVPAWSFQTATRRASASRRCENSLRCTICATCACPCCTAPHRALNSKQLMLPKFCGNAEEKNTLPCSCSGCSNYSPTRGGRQHRRTRGVRTPIWGISGIRCRTVHDAVPEYARAGVEPQDTSTGTYAPGRLGKIHLSHRVI